MKTIIRKEIPSDYREVENLVRESFWNVYRPGCMEHYVLHGYRGLPEFVPELSLVLELDGGIIGHIMYSRATIQCDDGSAKPIMIFGPVAIAPQYQKQGYGSHLIRFSLEKAREMGCGAVAITGNPGYYHRFGFRDARSAGVYYGGLPRTEETPFFMVKELIPEYLAGVTGVYTDPPGYLVSEEDVDRFDAAFPPKQKLKLPGQLF